MVLLQGPPGTGKTRTVLGVVSAILARREEKTTATSGMVVGGGGSASKNGVGDRGMGTTLEVGGARQKRPGVAGRWVAAKTHQRVSWERKDARTTPRLPLRSCSWFTGILRIRVFWGG